MASQRREVAVMAAGSWAILCSIAIGAAAIVRGVTFEAIIVWTLAATATGGVIGLAGIRRGTRRPNWSAAAGSMIAAGALPAVFSVGLLFVPAVAIFAWDSISEPKQLDPVRARGPRR